ncbi:hypothetical protein BVRB_5g098180 [Beta vulgaris subsp. vulgaris]|uniref:non-specific lipid transfer protein GPI-anchored 9 n=1 Tax=Beta vulgaris subsp. vulgaris TaxID=3555 RepID=UPI00053FCBB8|nr:non-specific lipid transfer protein GPI-anchored 9 [Beta vulgaris subsp. vulgaris]KMT12574.1 hypothetical protein BVRB_5g098180 [Beta vulgaris subsp. vulgaris]
MSKVLCLAALMVVLAVSSAQAQNVEMPQCVSELGPCGPFTNSTTVAPPTQCCQPLQNLIQNDLSCLCTVFANVELATTLMINVTEAATLPQRCNLQIDLLARCQALMGPSMAPSMGPSMVPSMAPSMSPERVPTPALMTPSDGPSAMSPGLMAAPIEGPSMSPDFMVPSEVPSSADAPISGNGEAPDLAPGAGGPAPSIGSGMNSAANGASAGPISGLMLLLAGLMFF